MDGILNEVEDFDGFLDLPNEFTDDISLDDLDSLEFINDLDGNLIYDCDIDVLNQPQSVNDYKGNVNNQQHSKVILNNTSNNYYRNCVSNELPMVFNNSVPSKENLSSGHNMIRELLSSDSNMKTNIPQGSYVSIERYGDTVSNRHYNISNGSQNIRTHENRNIVPKHPIILPASSGSNGHLLRTPTLAATLIGIQSSSNDNLDADSSSYGSGKVVRRNSHNAIEKRYRLSINDRIDELRHMLALGDNSKMNKSAVLRKAVERIRCLEQENNSLKCDNYNLRKSMASASSDESLNHTGSSPLSNQSDSGHSITNSPSSSSMHSTSVSSSFLFYKNNANQQCLISNSNKGVKRPLIYDNNNGTPVKTEKLARLLLSSSDSYEDKVSSQQKEIQNDRNQSKRLHSSNMPSFLLCTMALFIVAFQPFDMVLNNFRTKVVTATGGRKILQSDPLTDGLGLTVLLAMTHWLVAFVLVWGSTNNRYFLTKLSSFILGKTRSMTFVAFRYNTPLNGDTVSNVEKKLEVWRQDAGTFDAKLKDQLRLYHCECPRNMVAFVIELSAVLCGIIAKFVQLKRKIKSHDKDAHAIVLSLVTCAVEQTIFGAEFSRLESLWYKAVLVLFTLHGEVDDNTALSRLVLAQTLPIDIIRRYFVNKHLTKTLCQPHSVDSKYRCLMSSMELRKLLVKSSLKKVKEKLVENYLLLPVTSDAAYCYYLVYIQEALGSVIKKIRTQEVHRESDQILRDIILTSPTILPQNESRYINTLCTFVASVYAGEGSQNIGIMADKLLYYYNKEAKNTTTDDTRQLVLSLKLFLSTMKLPCGNDCGVHELNVNLIDGLTEKPITNEIARLIFDMALDGIIRSLNGQPITSQRHCSNIYFADKYASSLRDYSDRHTTGLESMVTKFNILFQSLCKLNPIRSGLPSIEASEQRKFDSHSYRVSEFLSLDGVGLREYNNSKMRSH